MFGQLPQEAASGLPASDGLRWHEASFSRVLLTALGGASWPINQSPARISKQKDTGTDIPCRPKRWALPSTPGAIDGLLSVHGKGGLGNSGDPASMARGQRGRFRDMRREVGKIRMRRTERSGKARARLVRALNVYATLVRRDETGTAPQNHDLLRPA